MISLAKLSTGSMYRWLSKATSPNPARLDHDLTQADGLYDNGAGRE
jgi:hypothetical protein